MSSSMRTLGWSLQFLTRAAPEEKKRTAANKIPRDSTLKGELTAELCDQQSAKAHYQI